MYAKDLFLKDTLQIFSVKTGDRIGYSRTDETDPEPQPEPEEIITNNPNQLTLF
jgi:hypothetical protein